MSFCQSDLGRQLPRRQFGSRRGRVAFRLHRRRKDGRAEAVLARRGRGVVKAREPGEPRVLPSRQGNRRAVLRRYNQSSPTLQTCNSGSKNFVRYPDGFPYLLLSRESLEGLNRRLDSIGLEVEEKRFRPNIFVRGDLFRALLRTNAQARE